MPPAHEPACVLTMVSQVQSLSGLAVKFYARVVLIPPEQPWIVMVEEGGHNVLVDMSSLEGAILDKGEWYRFVGEVLATDSVPPVVVAHGWPVRIEEFSSATYRKCISLRDNFVTGLERLVEYGNSTSKDTPG